jgi:hypothetical protein
MPSQLSCLHNKTSLLIIENSTSVYKKSPLRGRIIGNKGLSNFSLHSSISPYDGVKPPSEMAEHNSILSAPPFTAASTVLKSVVAISIR